MLTSHHVCLCGLLTFVIRKTSLFRHETNTRVANIYSFLFDPNHLSSQFSSQRLSVYNMCSLTFCSFIFSFPKSKCVCNLFTRRYNFSYFYTLSSHFINFLFTTCTLNFLTFYFIIFFSFFRCTFSTCCSGKRENYRVALEIA